MYSLNHLFCLLHKLYNCSPTLGFSIGVYRKTVWTVKNKHYSHWLNYLVRSYFQTGWVLMLLFRIWGCNASIHLLHGKYITWHFRIDFRLIISIKLNLRFKGRCFIVSKISLGFFKAISDLISPECEIPVIQAAFAKYKTDFVNFGELFHFLNC